MDTDEEVVGRCAFCDSDENITFIVLPQSSNLVVACSRCAVVLEEARQHLEQSATWYREQEESRIDEARGAIVVAAVLGVAGGTWMWDVGAGLIIAAGLIGVYGLLRGLRGT